MSPMAGQTDEPNFFVDIPAKKSKFFFIFLRAADSCSTRLKLRSKAQASSSINKHL